MLTKRFFVALAVLSLLFAPTFSAWAAGISTVRVAVFQVKTSTAIYQHAVEGFLQTLSQAGFKEGRNLLLEYFDASGDASLADEMAERIKLGRYSLVLSLGTKSTQTLQAAGVTNVPVLFTGVLDPVEAGVVKSVNGSGTNYAGSSHRQPLRVQLEYLRQLVPSITRLGVLFRADASTPRLQYEEAFNEQEALGLSAVFAGVAEGAADLPRATSDLVGKVDAIFLPSGILVSSSASKVVIEMAAAHGIPVFSAMSDPVGYGALLSVYTDMRKLGSQVGSQALRVLNGADPGSLPVEFQRTPNVVINLQTANELGIQIPDAFSESVTGVFGQYVVFEKE